jgi:hypothetical protein
MVLALMVAVVGCAEPSQSAAPSPSASSPSIASPTPDVPASPTAGSNSFSPVVIPPADMLPPGSVAVVTGDGLRVRGGPPGSAEFDQILALLSADDRVLVLPGPFSYLSAEKALDGRGWYGVQVGGRSGEGGYVAQGDSGLEYLATETAPCPGPEPGLDGLLQLSAVGHAVDQTWDRLACYGNATLDLEGMIDLVCNEGGMYPFSWEPAWLASPSSCIGLGQPDPNVQGFNPTQVALRFPDGLYAGWARGDLVRIQGHFDDSAANSCRIVPPDFPGQTPDPAFHVLFCREQFVVDKLTVTGHYDLPPLY